MTPVRFATFAAAALISGACANKSPTQATGTHSAVLQQGEVALVAGVFNLSLIRVDNDSRCPTDVTCASAGDATVVFTAVPPGPNGIGTAAMQFLHTNTEPRSLVLSGYRITLDSLSPRPVSTHVIAQGEYRAYMSVAFLPD